MKEHTTPMGTMDKSTHHIKYLHWKAVFAGAVMAMGMTFLFNLLTLALGLSLYAPDHTEKMALTFASVAWFVVGSYIVLFIPGWVAGRLVGHDHSFHLANGFLHGFVTWSLYLMISWLFLSAMKDATSTSILQSLFSAMQANHTASNMPTNEVHNIGYTGLVIFSAFFIGAMGCCIGASCGIKESKKHHMG